MASLGYSRICARVHEKLCQWGHSQITKKTTCVRAKIGFFTLTRNFSENTTKAQALQNAVAAAAASQSYLTQGCCHPCIRPEIPGTARTFATMRTQQPGSLPEYQIDPYALLEDDLKDVYVYIRNALRRNTFQNNLYEIATYYFDGHGKAVRPMVTILMAKAINSHMYKENSGLLSSQREVAMISEMIHTASLVHDDVIDQSDFRRGKPSVNVKWNHKQVTMAGDFILAVASMLIARLRNNDVTSVLSQVVTDLVQGEFMQLGSKETENERFAHYLQKTYRKTASLIANSLKAVAILAEADENLTDISYQYGRNLGIAFQLVDDLLDFVSSSEAMGKPTAADLKLGLATAPVLFACEKYPELNPMIMRRFQEPGDVEKAFELVHKSRGLEQTQFLARQHCQEAVRLANLIEQSSYQKGLIVTADYVLNRMK
ncbi:all trans-polyprenyl-diphosphate synthase PDSS1 [Diabrotica virgifera virgifera]|uniref:All trans-polyprenyl-diphosphate synthase PDSS1 n=1 Tax=Diabrotica virgifera virgifera TaxID=50390 RepID=A0A6P7FV16_DIAVI|nr:all trans-polyprenyl-diphosphate synthase PDSS1 [Diabrotica virgifera virgifera]XP_050511500.1 all trans-polyprenyl-diphosphate synthase PDSS1 [Diabrotica virgifera virgifera]